MKVEFKSQTSDGLNVIEEIPSITPCLLEGKNGIGKTVAVQLLQLISGEQPFEDPRLWMSLRDRLGATAVVITGLKGSERIDFEFAPDKWPNEPAEITVEALGSAKVDGKKVPASEASALLSVVRIAGNEDIVRTLSRRVETVRRSLDDVRRRVAAGREAVSDLLEPIVTELVGADPALVLAERERLEDMEIELNSAVEAAASARRDEATLHQALEAQSRIDALADPTNELVIQRDKLNRARDSLITARDELEKRVDAMADELSKRGDPQGALADAQRILRHRVKRLANLRDELERGGRELGVETSKDAIRAAFEAVEVDRQKLEQERSELGGSWAVRGLLEELHPVLADAAEDPSLADQTLFVTDAQSFTVAEVAALAIAREKVLEDSKVPAERQRVDDDLAVAAQRLRELHAVSTKLDDVTKHVKLVEEAEKQEREAEKAAEKQGEMDGKYRDSNRELGALQEQIESLTQQLAQAAKRLGSLGNVSAEDASKTLDAALKDIGATRDELESLQTDLPRRTVDLDQIVEALRKEVSALRRSLKLKSQEIRLLSARLFEGTEFEWIAAAIDPNESSLPEGPDAMMDRYVRAREIVLATAAQLDRSTEILDNLLGIAGTLDLLRDDDSGQLTQRYRSEFLEALGAHLRDSLNTRSIRDALFDGAEILSVDPIAKELTVALGSRSVTRPLAAFSTGEQAFAYTQARIQDLAPSDKPNRLLFLDEFGAFVAADRLPALADFLGGEAVQQKVDQVVVILPLHVDYETEIGQTTGDLHKRYSERLKEIKARGYCAVELST